MFTLADIPQYILLIFKFFVVIVRLHMRRTAELPSIVILPPVATPSRFRLPMVPPSREWISTVSTQNRISPPVRQDLILATPSGVAPQARSPLPAPVATACTQ